jgi:hypothetical protein
MLTKLFKRKTELTPQLPLDIESLHPRAGEVRQTAFEETLYLAPLPVFTGQQPVNIHDFPEVNATFLQLGGSNLGMVWQGKLLAWVIWLMMIMCIGCPFFLAVILWFVTPEGTHNSFLKDLGMLFVFFLSLGAFVAPLCLGVFVHSIISQTRQQARQCPLRFNRQRREVCFISDETHEVLIVPWEKVTAWVSQGAVANEYGATAFYTFGLALKNEKTGRVQPILLGKPSQAHAIGTWEAIRQYMEHGIPNHKDNALQSLLLGRAPTEYELRPYEGLHTWEVEKRRKEDLGSLHSCFTDEERAEIGLPKPTRWPLRRWYIWRVLSFWKMPYMIAEWGHKAGTPYIPEKVRDWSAPIPEEQWAKPSAELLKATQIVEQAMNRKKNKLNFIAACELIGGN